MVIVKSLEMTGTSILKPITIKTNGVNTKQCKSGEEILKFLFTCFLDSLFNQIVIIILLKSFKLLGFISLENIFLLEKNAESDV